MNTTQLTRFCPQERDSKTVGAKLNLPIHIYKMFSLARHSRDNGNPDIFLYRTSAAGRLTGLAKTIRRIILWVTALLPLCAAAPTAQTVLFLGDSITAGYGLDSPQAYPDLIQKKIDAKGWNAKRDGLRRGIAADGFDFAIGDLESELAEMRARLTKQLGPDGRRP